MLCVQVFPHPNRSSCTSHFDAPSLFLCSLGYEPRDRCWSLFWVVTLRKFNVAIEDGHLQWIFPAKVVISIAMSNYQRVVIQIVWCRRSRTSNFRRNAAGTKTLVATRGGVAIALQWGGCGNWIHVYKFFISIPYMAISSVDSIDWCNRGNVHGCGWWKLCRSWKMIYIFHHVSYVFSIHLAQRFNVSTFRHALRQATVGRHPAVHRQHSQWHHAFLGSTALQPAQWIHAKGTGGTWGCLMAWGLAPHKSLSQWSKGVNHRGLYVGIKGMQIVLVRPCRFWYRWYICNYSNCIVSQISLLTHKFPFCCSNSDWIWWLHSLKSKPSLVPNLAFLDNFPSMRTSIS